MIFILITLIIIQDDMKYELTDAHFWFGVNEAVMALCGNGR